MNKILNKEKNNKVTIAVVSMLMLFCIVLPYWFGVSLLFFVVLSVALWFYLGRVIVDDSTLLLKIVLIAFAVRFTLIVFLNIFSINIIQGDDVTYEQVGRYLAQNWLGKTLLSGNQDVGSLIYLGGTKNNYYFYLHAIVYAVLDFIPVAVRVITTFFGVLAGINVFILTRHLFNRRAAYISSVFTLFMPSLILWQIVNLKEAIVVFSITYVYRKIIVDVKGKITLCQMISILIGLGILFYTRNYAAFILGVLAFGYLIFKTEYKGTQKAMVVFLILIAFGVLSRRLEMGMFGINYFKMINLDFLFTAVRGSYTGGSEILTNISIKSYKDLIMFLPIGAFYFIFAPFPWHFEGSLVLWFASIENVIWYIMFVFLIIGVVLSIRKKALDVLGILAFIGAFVFIYSCVMFNMGVAFRYKSMLYPLLFIFVAGGLEKLMYKFEKRLV